MNYWYLLISFLISFIIFIIFWILSKPRQYRTHKSIEEYKEKTDTLTETPENNINKELKKEIKIIRPQGSGVIKAILSMIGLFVGLYVFNNILEITTKLMNNINETNSFNTGFIDSLNMIAFLAPVIGIIGAFTIIYNAFFDERIIGENKETEEDTKNNRLKKSKRQKVRR